MISEVKFWINFNASRGFSTCRKSAVCVDRLCGDETVFHTVLLVTANRKILLITVTPSSFSSSRFPPFSLLLLLLLLSLLIFILLPLLLWLVGVGEPLASPPFEIAK